MRKLIMHKRHRQYNSSFTVLKKKKAYGHLHLFMHRKYLKGGTKGQVGREALYPLFSICSDILRFIYNNHLLLIIFIFFKSYYHNIKREATVMALPKPSCPSVFLDFLPLSGLVFRTVSSLSSNPNTGAVFLFLFFF